MARLNFSVFTKPLRWTQKDEEQHLKTVKIGYRIQKRVRFKLEIIQRLL